MTIGREISSSTPALVVRTQGSDRSLDAGRSYSIGRNPESDIVVDEARVSWHHAVLKLEGPTWLLEDVDSTNGTFLGVQRVRRGEATPHPRAPRGPPSRPAPPGVGGRSPPPAPPPPAPPPPPPPPP